MEGKVSISPVYSKATGFAYVMGGVPVISEIVLENLGDRALSGLRLSVTSDDIPSFSAEYAVPYLGKGEILRFTSLPMPDGEFLSKIEKETDAEIFIIVSLKDEVLEAVLCKIKIYPPQTWLGCAYPKDIAASFVDPSFEAVRGIFAEKLSDAYSEKRTFGDIENLVSRVYSAVLEEEISAAESLGNFSAQTLRSPSEILEEKSATPLELALFFQSLFEKCSLYSELLLSEKDIFLKFTDGKDKLYLSVGAALSSANYEDAVFLSERRISRENVKIDLLSCRERGILPVGGYDVYSVSEETAFDNLPEPKNTEEEKYVLDFSTGLRRSAGHIARDESFVMNVGVFSDRKKIYEFLLKRFAEYGKTATFLFETENDLEKFSEVKNALFPKLAVTENGDVLLKKVALLMSSAKKSEHKFFSDLSLLSSEETRLDSFSALFTEKQSCGLSFSDAVAVSEKYADVSAELSLSEEYLGSLSGKVPEEDIELCREFARISSAVTPDSAEVFEKLRFTSEEPADAEKLDTLFEKYRAALLKLKQVAEIYREAVGISVSDRETVSEVAEMSRLLYSENIVPPTLIGYRHLEEISEIVKEAAAAGRARDLSEKFLFENFNREIFNFNVEAAENQWREASEKRSVTRNFEFGKIRKSIAAFAFEPSKIKVDDIPLILEKLREYKDNRDRVLTLGSAVAPVFGTAWNRGYCDWDSFEECYSSAVRLKELSESLSGGKLLAKISDTDGFCRKYAPLFKTAFTSFEELEAAEAELSAFDFSEIWKDGLDAAFVCAEKLADYNGKIGDLIAYSSVVHSLDERGLSFLRPNLENIGEEDVYPAFMKALARAVIDKLVSENGKLLRYGEHFFNKRVESLSTVRKGLEAKEPSAVFAVVSSALSSVSEREKGEIRLEAEKEDIKSFGRFVKTYPETSSVIFFAENATRKTYVQSEKRDFLVVFDDGNTDAEFVSEILPRYSAVILVVDAFLNTGKLFGRASGRYFTENCSSVTSSKLAEFVNYRFCNNSLKIRGLGAETEVVRVGGSSEKGVNTAEISEIYTRLSAIFKKKTKNITVKIAAFSEKQARAVRLFIEKNMTVPENVSLKVERICSSFDECDYLIVTTAYSGDKSELFRYSNVLSNIKNEEILLRCLASAKRKLTVITSLTAESVFALDYLPRSLSFFVRLVDSLSEDSSFAKKSPFLPETLSECGKLYTHRLSNIYFGEEQAALIYGISDSVLSDAETAALLSKAGYSAKILFPADRVSRKKEKPKEEAPAEEFVEAEFERYSVCVFGNAADMSEDAEEFMAAYNNPDIRKNILEVIGGESPVSLHTLAKRVLSHWGISRCGVRLENKVEALASELGIFTETVSGLKFYWKDRDDYKNYKKFRIPESGGFRREITEISPAELANVYKYIVGEYNIITVAGAERELIKILGFSRVTDKVKKHLATALELAEKRGFLRTVRGKIIRN